MPVGDNLNITTSSRALPDAESARYTPHSAQAEDEKRKQHFEDKATTPEFSPQRSLAPERIASYQSPASLQRSRSYGDGHGFIAIGKDEEISTMENAEEDLGKEYEVQWDGERDPLNPRNFSNGRKWVIVLILSAGSTCVTCTSSMYTSTYSQITSEFHVSRVVATLGLSLFVMGLGIGPMFLAPLSEFYGRRPIYVLSFGFFLVWLIPCAVARNVGTELVARFLDGIAGSAFLSVAGGTVGDMFTRNELQAPMMIYTASPFIGPPVGPMIAGFINQYTNW